MPGNEIMEYTIGLSTFNRAMRQKCDEIERLKAVIRRIFLHAVDREICDSIARGFALATIAGMCEDAIGSWCEKCEKIGCNCNQWRFVTMNIDKKECGYCKKELSDKWVSRRIIYRTRELCRGRFGRMENKVVVKKRTMLFCSNTCASRYQMSMEG